MQRAHRISSIKINIYILIFAFIGAAPLCAATKEAKAEMALRKAAASKAADKAKITAKAVQKAQDDLAVKRVNADKLQEVAAADKAKLATALGRNASRKEMEKLTHAAQKSGDSARKAQEEADKAFTAVQTAIVAARQAEVQEREAFEALDASRAGTGARQAAAPAPEVTAPPVEANNTPPPAAASPAPAIVPVTTPDDEEREKRLAQIEAAVEQAKKERALKNGTAVPAPDPAPAAVTPTPPATTSAPPASTPTPTIPQAPASALPASAAVPSLTPDMEAKAREMLRQIAAERSQAGAPSAVQRSSPAALSLAETPNPTAPPTAVFPRGPTMTPELEKKAREILRGGGEVARVRSAPVSETLAPGAEEQARELLRQAAPPQTAPPTQTVPSAPIAPATPRPATTAVTPVTPTLTPEMEKKARELLASTIWERQNAAPPAAATSPQITPPVAETALVPPPVAPPVTLPVVTPTTAPQAVAPPPVSPQPVPATLTADQDIKARELLKQFSRKEPEAVTIGTPPAAVASPVVPVIAAPPPVLSPPATLPVAAAPLITEASPAALPQLSNTSAPAAGMTPEQEMRAHQLLDQRISERPSRLDLKVTAKMRREAQMRAETEAKALEAQRKAAASSSLNSTPAPVLPPQTQTEAPAAAIPPDSQTTEAERAHQQALKNAAAAAKTQFEDQTKQPQKPFTIPPSTAEKTETKAKPASHEAKAAPESNPLPVSGVKQQRLMQLLESYKKDQITPAQYHQERARILADP